MVKVWWQDMEDEIRWRKRSVDEILSKWVFGAAVVSMK